MRLGRVWWAVPEPWSPALGHSASGSLEKELRLCTGSGERSEDLGPGQEG